MGFVRSYLIRVQLPDRPGALGAVASRIGSAGGDVVSIDILERDKGVVVDELGVGLAGEHLLPLVRDEILEVDGVCIEAVREVEGPVQDRLADLLDAATDLFGQPDRGDVLHRLAVHARHTLAAAFAAVVDPLGGRVLASDGDVPDGEELAPAGAPSFEEETPRRVATAEMLQSGLLLVVGRDDPVIRARERQWISIMADLADHCCRMLPTAG